MTINISDGQNARPMLNYAQDRNYTQDRNYAQDWQKEVKEGDRAPRKRLFNHIEHDQ